MKKVVKIAAIGLGVLVTSFSVIRCIRMAKVHEKITEELGS